MNYQFFKINYSSLRLYFVHQKMTFAWKLKISLEFSFNSMQNYIVNIYDDTLILKINFSPSLSYTRSEKMNIRKLRISLK